MGRDWTLIPGHASPLIDSDCDAQRSQSPAVLLENGKPIGQPHAAHADIRERGQGLYSHWLDTLYFSASDNTDPNENGRAYTLRLQRSELRGAV